MAIFHLNFKVLTRTTKSGKSKSSLYLAAYNAREKLTDELTGLNFDYTKKNDLYKSGIILPENAPHEFYDRSTLWNAAEKKEKRKDSQICRYFIIALPKELNGIKNEELLINYLKNNFVKKGMIADYAIHDEKGKPHAHVMLSMRKCENGGFSNKKAREWNDPKLVEIWRRQWAAIVNKTLRNNNKKDRITHLSFLRQKELLIQKAHEEVEKNNIEKAEALINGAKILANKKPVKRKPTVVYLKNKERMKKINPALRERIKQQQNQKEETTKKENKLNLIFKNLVLRFNNIISKKTEVQKQKITEADFFKNMKIEDEEIKEDIELKKYIKNEIKKGDSENEFNHKNEIPHKPRRIRFKGK